VKFLLLLFVTYLFGGYEIVFVNLKFVSPSIIIQFKQINQLDCNNFSSLLLDVYVQLNMFWA